MRSQLLILAAVWLLAGHAVALADDRPMTDEEKTKLTAAMQAEGCSGGSMKLDDDDVFEVDDAKCGDRQYDLEFDRTFKLISKEADD